MKKETKRAPLAPKHFRAGRAFGVFRASLAVFALLSAPFTARAHGRENGATRLQREVYSAQLRRAAPPTSARPLRPGSRFTERDRARAVTRGLRFIYETALDERNFAEYGSDYLWCFYTISASVADPAVRREARRMGVELARRRRSTHRELPHGADAQLLADYVFGHDAAASLGLPDPALAAELRRAAARFTARDFLRFDPAREPPPPDVPDDCRVDQTPHERGATHCRTCGRPLRMRTRQDVWYDALITAYTFERAGVPCGASYEEVFRLLPTLRPYPPPRGPHGREFIDTAYALTHVVYTLNDYGQLSLSRHWLPREFAFLRAALPEAIRLRDADMLGELIDSLRAFGLDERDEGVRAGVEYLLANQNPDGSWGDPNEQDIYLRYHPTWGGVAALSRYPFARGRSPRFRRVRNLPGI
jgi:hypothetical protein